ncbi:hypothetical protein GCM10023189_49440 [Nibrella saemangeumensis]|uniref:Signal transduction histidine kinase internal region domain-containing protein n=1 Tax=Nibrella saemangeumensis TaxID=1084526 RepID=A0ABP8NJX9_9BACT
MKKCYSFVWLCLCTVTLCWGQSSVEIEIKKLPDQGILLDKGWKWQAGDNTDWAKPEFDDSAWEAIDPTRDIFDLPQLDKQTGRISWFRLRFQVRPDSALHQQLVMQIQQSGASEIYLNGRLIHRIGKLSANPSEIKAFTPHDMPISFPVSWGKQQVLAVRYALQPGIRYGQHFGRLNSGLTIRVNTLAQAIPAYSQYQVSQRRHNVYIGAFGVMAVLFLAFFLFFPTRPEALYFGLMAACSAGSWVGFNYLSLPIAVAELFWYNNAVLIMQAISYIFQLQAIYSTLHQKRGWVYWGLIGFGLFSIFISAFVYPWGWFFYGFGLTTLANLEVTRVAFLATRQRRPGVWIVLLGGCFYALCWLLFCLAFANIYTLPVSIDFFTLAFLSIPVSYAIYFGYDFGRTNRSLRQKISEVETLSKEKQQILSQQNERLEQQLANRTREIEAQSRLLEQQHIRQIETEFERKLADTEMVALRAQMNPHFIFNSLNSIKLYTIQNDSEQASDFLTKFSRLIRLVLENSRSELVSLRNELEALQLYIELEAMRFKEKLRYQISVSPEIDLQYLRIPPLLLQPYVENAIWHGLMHKPEGGTVTIEVQQPQDNLLHIEITDDGVGRQRATELKSKSAGKHKSFGMQVTADRIRMINQLYNMQTQAQIEDLVDSYGEACGTRVTLTIPV